MKRMQRNKGFTLVELLISMALLSIIMLIVVQFMSTTTAAQKRTKYNLKAQTAANELMNNISDTMAQASYVRVVPAEAKVYEKTSGTRIEPMVEGTSNPTSDSSSFAFDLVPDDYGNYVRNTDTNTKNRKVIVDMDTYQLVGEKQGTVYPLTNDLEAKGTDVRSFRCMKQKSGPNVKYLYVKPAYIYVEYNGRTTNEGGDLENHLYYVMYRFDYSEPDSAKVYMVRGETNHNTSEKLAAAKSAVDALSDEDGLLTDDLEDFYLSCDAEGGAFMLDALMDVKGYMYNATTTVAVRNTEVLTAKPINSYQLGEGSTSEESGWKTPGEGEESGNEESGESGESGETKDE